MIPIELKNTPLYNDSSLLTLLRMEGNSNDEKGNNNGTDTSMSYSSGAGKFGQGANFAGSGYITLPSGLADFTKGITISLWAYPTATVAHARFIDLGGVNGAGNANILFYRSGLTNELGMYIGNGTAYFSFFAPNAITNNEWHSYTMSINTNGIAKVYRDGILIGTGTMPVPPNTSRATNRIGHSNWTGDSPYQGYLDDIAIFQRALSDKEVKEIYDGTSEKFTENNLSKYRKDRFVGFIPKGRRISETLLFSDSNLWGYWKLDGNSLDSKASNNGTDTFMTYPVRNSYFDKMALFNGSTSHIQVTNLTHGTSDFSYSWWIKFNTPLTSNNTCFENGTWPNALLIRWDTPALLAIYSMNALIGYFHFAPITDKLYHLAVIRSGSTLSLYVDGVLFETMAFTVNVQPSVNMWVGASQHNSTQCLNGYMSDIAIFTRALIATEIGYIYNGFPLINNLKDYKRLEDFTEKIEIETNELTSPLQLNGCKLWIDASKLNVSDNTSMASVPDLSGNNANMTQATVSKQPILKTNIINGLSVLRHTIASATTWDIPWAHLSPCTFFYIAKKAGAGNVGRLLSGKTNNWLMGYHGGLQDRAYYEGWVSTGGAVDANTHIWSGITDSTSSLWNNSALVGNSNGGVTAPAGLCIGYLGTSEFSDGDIGEIIGFNRALSDHERRQIERYLATKWGVTLVATETQTGFSATGGVVSYVGGKTIHTFSSSGIFTPTVSGSVEVYLWGGGGAGGTPGGWGYGSAGGSGGMASGIFNVTAGVGYIVSVGGGGVVNSAVGATGGGAPATNNNADNRYAGGGGGYSGIFVASVSQANAIIIAGGGGGGGSSRAGAGNGGGGGGGSVGQVGYSTYDAKSAYGGNPGTQSAAGADASCDSANTASNQGALQGGWVRINSYGGGGGGGYWGGSAGGYSEANTMGGGGGGSAYFNPTYIIPGILTTSSGTSTANPIYDFRGSAGNAGGASANGVSGVVVIRY